MIPELELALLDFKEEERLKETEFKNRPGGTQDKQKEPQVASKVRGQIVGGAVQDFDGVATVGEVAAKLDATDRTATVNGVPVEHTTTLKDYDFVAFTDKKKGGA